MEHAAPADHPQGQRVTDGSVRLNRAAIWQTGRKAGTQSYRD